MKSNRLENFPANSFIHFDLDGTLLDTTSANISSYREAVTSVGGIWTQAASRLVLNGMGSEDFLKKCLDVDSHQYGEIRRRKIEIYPSKFEEVQPIGPVFDLLENVSPRAALVTSASRESTFLLLTHFGLLSYFSHIITASDLKTNKPSPEGYLKSKMLAETMWGGNLTHLAVEDSAVGSKAATAAGMLVLDAHSLF